VASVFHDLSTKLSLSHPLPLFLFGFVSSSVRSSQQSKSAVVSLHFLFAVLLVWNIIIDLNIGNRVFWNNFGTILRQFWGSFETIFVIFCDFVTILEQMLGDLIPGRHRSLRRCGEK